MRTGTGVAGLAMLAHQLNNYEGILTNLTAQLIEVINELQREANREFTPIIAANLASSYEWCAAEVGPGMSLTLSLSVHHSNFDQANMRE